MDIVNLVYGIFETGRTCPCPSWLDLVNGIFEAGGAGVMALDVRQLIKDKQIKGVFWPSRFFFFGWGFWNIAYYSWLYQWYSFGGGIALVTANLIWCALALKYKLLCPSAKPEELSQLSLPFDESDLYA